MVRGLLLYRQRQKKVFLFTKEMALLKSDVDFLHVC
jgi:hypothetical protein